MYAKAYLWEARDFSRVRLHLSSSCCKHLVIPPAFWDKFTEDVTDPCVVYEEYYNPAYIVIRCVEAEQAENISTIKQLRPAMKIEGVRMDPFCFVLA